MSYKATPNTATGVSPCQLMMGRQIRTIVPTLESNLKPKLPDYEAVAERDKKTKAAYPQAYNKRHGVRRLSELQPGDLVRVKLDEQKGWKTPGKIIARSTAPRSYFVQTPQRVVRRNRRHLCPTSSPVDCEPPEAPEELVHNAEPMPDKAQELPSTVLPSETTQALQSHPHPMSSTELPIRPPEPEVRTSSGRVVRKPSRPSNCSLSLYTVNDISGQCKLYL